MIGSFCREYDEGLELVQELTAKNVVEVVGGNVCECVSEVMRGFDQPQTDHNTICGRIFAKIDEDVGINSRGFRIERLCVNFERTHDERLRQLLGESRFRMRQQEINVDETTYMMDLTRKEYRAVRGV